MFYYHKNTSNVRHNILSTCEVLVFVKPDHDDYLKSINVSHIPAVYNWWMLYLYLSVYIIWCIILFVEGRTTTTKKKESTKFKRK